MQKQVSLTAGFKFPTPEVILNGSDKQVLSGP